MDELSAQDFIAAARALCLAAVGLGLVAPSFRSPPRRGDTPRTIRRYDGGAVVAVRRWSRPAVQVLADMVDGVLAASRVQGGVHARARPQLMQAALEAVGRPAPLTRVPAPATAATAVAPPAPAVDRAPAGPVAVSADEPGGHRSAGRAAA